MNQVQTKAEYKQIHVSFICTLILMYSKKLPQDLQDVFKGKVMQIV